MTHDHAEDAALVDAALRIPHLALDRADRLERQVEPVPQATWPPTATTRRRSPGSTTPIGLPGLAGKEPAVIAVSVAAALLQAFAGDPATLAEVRR